jgi:hypothetical protein
MTSPVSQLAACFGGAPAANQGLTLVHFSAQPEPFLTQIHPVHPKHPLTPPQHPLNTPYTIPTCTPYPKKNAYVELKGVRV